MQFLGIVIAICGLVFVFWGEPDVWDAMHAKAMSPLDCPKAK